MVLQKHAKPPIKSAQLCILFAFACVAYFLIFTPFVMAEGLPVSIRVGKIAYGISYDYGKGTVFVSNAGSNTVSVISDDADTVVGIIPVGIAPHGITYDHDRGEVFVANLLSNTVSVISDSKNAVVYTVPVGSGPHGIAYDSGKSEVFVANEKSNTVSVISDRTNRVVATVEVGAYPYYLASGPDGKILVSRYASEKVTVISDKTNKVEGDIDAGAVPFGMVYDPLNDEVFMTLHNSDTVSEVPYSSCSPVPEFGPLEPLVAAASLAGIILVSRLSSVS